MNNDNKTRDVFEKTKFNHSYWFGEMVSFSLLIRYDLVGNGKIYIF